MGRPAGSKNKIKQEIIEEEQMSEIKGAAAIEEPVRTLSRSERQAKAEFEENTFLENGRRYLSKDNEPLCLTCTHRQDMHHTWKERTEYYMVRTYQGEQQRARTARDKDFSDRKPCQHACKCSEYK